MQARHKDNLFTQKCKTGRGYFLLKLKFLKKQGLYFALLLNDKILISPLFAISPLIHRFICLWPLLVLFAARTIENLHISA